MNQGPIILDTPGQIAMARLITLRSALKLEINTGMKATRIPLGRVCKQYGITARTKVKQYAEVDALIVEAGGTSVPLE